MLPLTHATEIIFNFASPSTQAMSQSTNCSISGARHIPELSPAQNPTKHNLSPEKGACAATGAREQQNWKQSNTEVQPGALEPPCQQQAPSKVMSLPA